MTEVNYAKVGGPPLEWWRCEIIDLDTGERVEDVVEANSAEGWLVRAKRDSDGYLVATGEGDDTRVATERSTGRFKIVYGGNA